MSKTFDRREAVAGIGAVTLGWLLAACGSDSSSGSGSTCSGRRRRPYQIALGSTREN